MNFNWIRQNLPIILVAVSIISGWTVIQMEITNVKAQITRMETELQFTKSMYYSVENKITELQVEVRNLNRNIDLILAELKSR